MWKQGVVLEDEANAASFGRHLSLRRCDQVSADEDAAMLQWLKPRGENLTARLAKFDDAQAVAEELYLSVLSRFPTSDEVDRMLALPMFGRLRRWAW